MRHERWTHVKNTIRYLSEVQLGSTPAKVRVQILRKGEWVHPSAPGGVLRVDDSLLQAIEEAFRSGVRGKEVPANINHKSDDFAVGWLREVQRENGALYGIVDVVDEGVARALKEQKLRYCSAEIAFNYVDPETQQEYPAVLKGVAFTNFPFIKQMQPAEVLNLSEIQEVHDMEERLKQLEEQMAKYQAQLAEMEAKTVQLQEENQKLRQANDALIAETRRQQDEILLKDFEDTIPPAVRKVVSALLAMTRGEEVMLSEFRPQEQRKADLRDLVLLLLNEVRALSPQREPERVADRRTVGDDTMRLMERAEEIARQHNVPFHEAIRQAFRNATR